MICYIAQLRKEKILKALKVLILRKIHLDRSLSSFITIAKGGSSSIFTFFNLPVGAELVLEAKELFPLMKGEVLIEKVIDMKELMSLTNNLLQNDPSCHIVGIHFEMDQFAFIHQADPTKVRIDNHDGQNDNIENLNEGSGVADQENHSNKGDRASQDEAVTIVVDEEFQAATADKLKGKKNKKRVVGASGSGHPLNKL
nr:hypothetical protein [Tanacetum cinerariifolium]